jgi:preprotein translocase SecE subunit
MTSRAQKAKIAKPVPTPAKKKSRLSFFPEAVEELKKAHWPTRRETARLSILVLIVCVVVGAILGALDYGFTRLIAVLLPGG